MLRKYLLIRILDRLEVFRSPLCLAMFNLSLYFILNALLAGSFGLTFDLVAWESLARSVVLVIVAHRVISSSIVSVWSVAWSVAGATVLTFDAQLSCSIAGSS